MEHGQHHEVRPLELLSFVGGIVAVVGLEETILGQQIPVDGLRLIGLGF